MRRSARTLSLAIAKASTLAPLAPAMAPASHAPNSNKELARPLSSTAWYPALNIDTINPKVLACEYAVRGEIVAHAEENPELWKWLTGQEATPDFLTANPVFMAIHNEVVGALNTHAPAETRAKLGQPWVRGWDDNRRVGGPQVGNQ